MTKIRIKGRLIEEGECFEYGASPAFMRTDIGGGVSKTLKAGAMIYGIIETYKGNKGDTIEYERDNDMCNTGQES